MPKFTYHGEDKAGTTVKETVTAPDRFAVYNIARENGHTVSKIDESGGLNLSMIDVEKIEYAISRVKLDELVLVSRNLGAMLKAGLSLSRALSVIERQSKNPRLKGIVVQVRERINGGDQFNEALAEHPDTFDDLYVSMVKAGEEGGSLADTLQVLAVQMERASTLRKKVKGAMIYPAIVITIMVGIGFLMMIFVMPSITDTFTKLNVDLPPMTVALITVSDFVNGNILLVLGILFSSLIALVYFMRTELGKTVFHYAYIKAPIIGIITRETNAARTARTLSSLLSSGVDVLRALSITEEVIQNKYYKKIIVEAAKQVENGKPLSGAFIARSDLYPVLVGEMIAVGEETGQISKMMSELAVFYETEVENRTDNLSTIIEPLLMVVIGGGVGVFALAMIAPIYSVGEGI